MEAYLEKLKNPPEGYVLFHAEDDKPIESTEGTIQLIDLLIEKVKAL
jgi:hypothetical protein